MNSNHIMVVVIVAIVMVASIIRAGISAGSSRREGRRSEEDEAETRRLRDEVKQLKDRLAVLERITVERENSLERQIEALRDG